MSPGARFAKSGLGLFIFGVFLVFGIIGHYCVGARWPTGAVFLQNITLWYACPWTLSVAPVQAGALGMVALGLAEMTSARLLPQGYDLAGNPLPLRLSVIGLIGVFLVGYPGYFAFDRVWPSFYYSPIAEGKNAWLLSQAFFIAVYFVGAFMMFDRVRRTLAAVPAVA
jgi:hypothetical protein